MGVMSTKLENKIKHVYVKSEYDGIFLKCVDGVNNISYLLSFKSTSSSWKVRYISILKMEICLSVKKTKINLCRYLKSTTTPLTTSVWMAVTAVVS